MATDYVKTYRLFKIDREPVELTPKQIKIYDSITLRTNPRTQVIAPTQYGKSETVAMALIIAAVAGGYRWNIMAPSMKKSKIIMEKCIEHCFDDNIFISSLRLDDNISLDRLRRERSKTKLTFRSGGGIQALTLDARNSKQSMHAAMGFGGDSVVEDESALISDQLNSSVIRMLGGYPYKDTFFMKIGNPFHRNHFKKTWDGDRYDKIFIDYLIGLQEGRYDEEFIEEMRDEAFFDIYYECAFPPEDEVDEKGYRRLLTAEQIEAAMIDGWTYNDEDELWLGVDIGGGSAFNAYVMHTDAVAWIETKNKSNTTMINVHEIQRILDKYPKLRQDRVYIDDTMIGRGVSDRCRELGLDINPVVTAMAPKNKKRYKNVNAECAWDARKWVMNGGKFVRDNKFKQLSWVRYRPHNKVMELEPKPDLIKRERKSPDFGDAFRITFSRRKRAGVVRIPAA